MPLLPPLAIPVAFDSALFAATIEPALGKSAGSAQASTPVSQAFPEFLATAFDSEPHDSAGEHGEAEPERRKRCADQDGAGVATPFPYLPAPPVPCRLPAVASAALTWPAAAGQAGEAPDSQYVAPEPVVETGCPRSCANPVPAVSGAASLFAEVGSHKIPAATAPAAGIMEDSRPAPAIPASTSDLAESPFGSVTETPDSVRPAEVPLSPLPFRPWPASLPAEAADDERQSEMRLPTLDTRGKEKITSEAVSAVPARSPAGVAQLAPTDPQLSPRKRPHPLETAASSPQPNAATPAQAAIPEAMPQAAPGSALPTTSAPAAAGPAPPRNMRPDGVEARSPAPMRGPAVRAVPIPGSEAASAHVRPALEFAARLVPLDPDRPAGPLRRPDSTAPPIPHGSAPLAASIRQPADTALPARFPGPLSVQPRAEGSRPAGAQPSRGSVRAAPEASVRPKVAQEETPQEPSRDAADRRTRQSEPAPRADAPARDPETRDAGPAPGSASGGAPQPAVSAPEIPRRTGETARPETAAPQRPEPDLRAAAVEPDRPASVPAAAREIRLEMSAGERKIEVRLADGGGGDLHLAVRTPDARLNDALRDNVAALSERLEPAGYRVEAWEHPSGARQTQHQPTPDTPASGGEDGRGHERQQQNRRPAPEEFEQRQRKEKREEFAWYMASLPQ